MSTYRHPPLATDINNATYTVDGLLKTDARARESDGFLKELLVELKINNLHNALTTNEDITEEDIR